MSVAQASLNPVSHARENLENRWLIRRIRKAAIEIAGDNRRVDLPKLQKILNLKDEYFAKRVFSSFDRRRGDFIDLEEFLTSVEELITGTQEAQLRFAFQIHDADGDGLITQDDLSRMIRASLDENGLAVRSEPIEKLLVSILFNGVNITGDGSICFEEFEAALKQYPRIYKQMTSNAATWLGPRRRQSRPRDATSFLTDVRRYVENNLPKVAFLAIYTVVNLTLFWHAVSLYASMDANIFVQIARGCGACLNFNAALILVPMMRNLLTWLRKTVAHKYLPLDENIGFHRLIGFAMLGLSAVHTAAHLINYAISSSSVIHGLFLTGAGITGILLLAVFAIMVFGERMRGTHFELFYVTHLAFVIWFVLALLHGPNLWQWVLLPCVGYAIERFIRFHNAKEPTCVTEVSLLPSRVTHLKIERPKSFKFRPGDYVRLRIPAISKFEWHPFTISSCPEEKGRLSVHIRSLGNWTSAIHNFLKDGTGKRDKQKMAVHLDGPYGAPSAHIFESEYAVLIGAGIGVTPFASILKSILHQYKHNRQNGMKLKKVYFFWISRDQQSFEWFAEMLSELEAQDTDGLLDINIYVTGAKANNRSSMLNLALDLLYSRVKVDLVTGLKSRTKFGHPNWERIFRKLNQRYVSEMLDVYFCGPLGLSHKLKTISTRFGFNYRVERF